MDGPISATAEERLPGAIKALDETARKVYILMRLRKSEQQVAGILGMPMERAQEVMDAVRHVLIRADQIDLVEDPRFVPLTLRDEEGEREIPIPSAGLPVEDRLIVREFVRHLRAAVESLAPKKAAVLRLRYRDDLTAREIAAFAAKTGMDLVPGKKPADVREQDVYPVLHGVFLEILASLKDRYGGDFRMGPAHLKEILEDVGV